MNMIKISFVAAITLCTSSFAIENIEINGAGKFYYATLDGTDTANWFDKKDAYSQLGLDLSVGADLGAGFKGKAGITGLATAGMVGKIVDDVWATGVAGSQLWLSELYVNKNILDKTILTLGRQSLDTPFIFTERWNIAVNTFDAAAFVNTDISDTTFIGIYIDRGNGKSGSDVVNPAITDSGRLKDPFKKFYDNGAFTAGVINTSLNGTQLQGWYYNIDNTAKAYWLQADVEYKRFTFGAQAVELNFDDTIDTAQTSKAYATKIGYIGIENITLGVAFSQTDKDGSLDYQIANLATGASDGAETNLYTEAWGNCGYVGRSGTRAYTLSTLYAIHDMVDVELYYTSNNQRVENGDADLKEYTTTVAKSFGKLDTRLAYIYAKAKDFNENQWYSTLQVYITYNF